MAYRNELRSAWVSVEGSLDAARSVQDLAGPFT